MEAVAVQNNQNIEETSRQFIVVKIGNEQYGINIKYVDNIVRMQRITRVPKSQTYFAGVINLRGEIVPVMSLRRKFGIPDEEPTSATRIIILKPEQQATVGFVVDMVKEVVTLDDESIEKNNISDDKDNLTYISAVGKNNGELISILNLQTVMAD